MTQPRIQELDALRGLAAMAVVLFHYTTHFDELAGHRNELLVSFPWGHLGVQMFFVISGFVIFMTIVRCNSILDFGVSRFSRLYPAYWSAVILTSLVLVVFQSGPSLSQLAANLTMLQGFMGIRNIDGVYWTLTYELIFYLLAAAAFVFGQIGRAVVLVVAWFGLQTAATLSKLMGMEWPWAVTLGLLLEYCNLFGAGALFFCYARGLKGRVIAPLLAVSVANEWMLRGPVSAAFVAGVFVIFFLVAQGKLRMLASGWLVFLGAISYTLYLTHQRIGYLVLKQLENRGLEANTAVLLTIAVALLVATTLTKLIEQPALRFIRQSYKRWRGKQTVKIS